MGYTDDLVRLVLKKSKNKNISIDDDLMHLIKRANVIINSYENGINIKELVDIDNTLIYKYRNDKEYFSSIQLGTLFKLANLSNQNSGESERIILKLEALYQSDYMNNKTKLAESINIPKSQLNHLTSRNNIMSMSTNNAIKILDFFNSKFNPIVGESSARVSYFYSRRGGVGKTVLSFYLAKYLSLQEYKVLLIDYSYNYNLSLLFKKLKTQKSMDLDLPYDLSDRVTYTYSSDFLDLISLKFNDGYNNSFMDIFNFNKELLSSYDYIIFDSSQLPNSKCEFNMIDRIYLPIRPMGNEMNSIDIRDLKNEIKEISSSNIPVKEIVNLADTNTDLTKEIRIEYENNNDYISMFNRISAINEELFESKTVFEREYKDKRLRNRIFKNVLMPTLDLVKDLNNVDHMNINKLNLILKDEFKVSNVFELTKSNFKSYYVINDLIDYDKENFDKKNEETVNIDVRLSRYTYLVLEEIIKLNKAHIKNNMSLKYESLEILNENKNLNIDELIVLILMGTFKPDLKLQRKLLYKLKEKNSYYYPLVKSGYLTPDESKDTIKLTLSLPIALKQCFEISRIDINSEFLKQKFIRTRSKLINHIDDSSIKFKYFLKLLLDDSLIVNYKLHSTLFSSMIETFFN